MAGAVSQSQSAGSAQPGGGTASAQETPSAPAVVPFLRGSGKGKYKFYSKSGLTLTTATQDLGPIDVKAYDYMRSILVTLTTTSAGGANGTVQADGPFNAFTNVAVKQPNGQTMYQVSSGHSAYLIHKYGGNRDNPDPRSYPEYQAAGTAITFAFRIPFELDLRDALGALPNKDAAAPFTLELTLNTLTNVLGSSQGTSPTFTVEAWLEAYDQPPQTLNGQPVETTPPNMNTLQRWTEQNITLNSGQFDARVRKLGNYVRCILPVLLNSSNVREDTDWPDPSQIVLDEDVKDNISLQDWKRRTYEMFGYGAVGTTADATGTGQTPGRDVGVLPIVYYRTEQLPTENANLYLPTIESEDYLIRGSWGSTASKLRTLVCEVLPQGDIWG